MAHRYGWSRDKNVWQTLRELSGPIEWREVLFGSSSAWTVPEAPGVYLIIAPPPLPRGSYHAAALRTPLYVGHTGDLRNRMRQHLRAGAMMTGPFTKMLFCYARTPDTTAARRLEQSLMNAFGPPFNKRASIRGSLGAPIPAGRARVLA